MTRKTPEQKLQELEERQAKLEAELKLKRSQIQRAKSRERAKIQNAMRKEETRRKILIGAVFMKESNANKKAKAWMTSLLDKHLELDRDRALFKELSNSDNHSRS